jgi:transcriptional regulator with XRE-family HTH domain
MQAQFARELGISQGQLSRYEQGRNEIGAEILLRLARRSGKTIEWLLTGYPAILSHACNGQQDPSSGGCRPDLNCACLPG